jgi:hypothetical protein
VSEFVEECRREWKRLGVPEPIANEMAADLTADLHEAEAEGGSPEDVLGNSAFDPRRFAAAWATAQGVTSPAAPQRSSFWRPPTAIALLALLGVLIMGCGLVLVVGRSSSVAFAARRIVAGPGSIRLFPPAPVRVAPAGPLGPVFGITHVGVHPIAVLLLLIAVTGLVGLGLAVLYWSPWSSTRRRNRRGDPRSPNWN